MTYRTLGIDIPGDRLDMHLALAGKARRFPNDQAGVVGRADAALCRLRADRLLVPGFRAGPASGGSAAGVRQPAAGDGLAHEDGRPRRRVLAREACHWAIFI